MNAVTGSGSGAFTVEVRRPLHRPSPTRRLRDRLRARRERRQAKRGPRGADGSKTRWYDFLQGDLDALAALAAVVALVLLLVFGLPFVWILVLFVVEFLLWVALAAAGGAAWLVLGRPWQVVVVDPAGTDVALAAVRGRRAAHEHADRVRARLSAGAARDAAVMAL